MAASKATRQLTLTALFIALVVLLGLTPLGLIPLGFINVTILHIPVIIGALVLGLKGGLILGCAFGLVSTLRAFGIPLPASALVSNLMAESPLLVVVMSMLPRLLVPLATCGLCHLLERRGARRSVALAACGGGGHADQHGLLPRAHAAVLYASDVAGRGGGARSHRRHGRAWRRRRGRGRGPRHNARGPRPGKDTKKEVGKHHDPRP